MNVKKICFVVPKVYPYFDPSKGVSGGAERQVFYLGTELAKDKAFDVHYISADYGQAKTVRTNNVTIINAFSFKENALVGFIKLAKNLLKVDANVYVFRSASSNLLPVFLLLKLFRKKTVYMVANIDEGVPEKLAVAKGKLGALSMFFSYKLASRISVQTNEQKVLFAKHRNIIKTTLLRNIYNISPELPQSKKNTILWVGRCIPWKQPEVFIELASHFANEKFVMVCPKVHSDIDYWSEISVKAHDLPNLEFLDYIESHELKKYYAAAKIYTITSVSEGMPNTMLEAAEANCAMLSLNINPDGMINQYKMGSCVHNKDELFIKLKELIENKEFIIEAGSNAFQYLSKEHNEKSVIPIFKEIVDELL